MFKNKKKEFYNQEHKELYNFTKKNLRLDIGLNLGLMLLLLLLVYNQTFSKLISYTFFNEIIAKLLIVFIIFILIGIKEKNSFKINTNLEKLKEFKNLKENK